jgi:hypothetical protein
VVVGRWALLSPLLVVGCSPITYARRAAVTERAVRAAEHAEAVRLAPYELTLAKVYLDKAREESGQAHYALSLDLLRRAEQSAKRARVLAEARTGGGAP